MRRKRDSQQFIEWPSSEAPKTVTQYRQRYKRLSDLLDVTPGLLSLVSRDLRRLSGSSRRGRKAVYTCQTILRALIVHQLEGTSLRQTVIRISESDTLRSFIRLGNRPVMDYSFLDKCFKAIEPSTWQALNDHLGQQAAASGAITPSTVRTDVTLVETNIHYPTDSSLLWDSWRVLSRLLGRARSESAVVGRHRFHTRKVKKLHLTITRYAASRAAGRRRLVKLCHKKLIEQVERIAAIARALCAEAGHTAGVGLRGPAAEIEGYLPLIDMVCSTARRAQLRGETVPACERVFSIFEGHTELIKRGKRSKPVEFGHCICLTQTCEKFITDYEAMPKRVPDSALAPQVVQKHEALFGAPPEVIAADSGFHGKQAAMAELAQAVEVVAIPRKPTDWGEVVLAPWQAFRAGIEGTISVLKRAYRLYRCVYRGFKSFASSIGMAVFCHNLVLLADAPGP